MQPTSADRTEYSVFFTLIPRFERRHTLCYRFGIHVWTAQTSLNRKKIAWLLIFYLFYFSARFSFLRIDQREAMLCVVCCVLRLVQSIASVAYIFRNEFYKIRFSSILFLNSNITNPHHEWKRRARTIAFDLLNAYTEFEFLCQRNGTTHSMCVYIILLFFVRSFVSFLLPLPLRSCILRERETHIRTHAHRTQSNRKSTL